MSKLDEIKNIDRDFLTPKEASAVLGCSEQTIRVQAHQDARKLGFPVVILSSRIKIPRLPFIEFMTKLDGHSYWLK